MSKKTNIIKINGRHYDANTGVSVNAPETDINGVYRPTMSDIRPSSSAKGVLRHPTKSRAVAAHAHSHTPQPTSTLMRAPLKKPTPTHRHPVTSLGRVDLPTKKSVTSLSTKLSVTSIDNKRLRHAKLIPKNRLVSHFNSQTSSVSYQASQATPRLIVADIAPVRFSKLPKVDFLQSAIDQATSHLEPPYQPPNHQRRHLAKKIVAISSSIAAVLVLVGIVGYQNIDSLRLHLASSRAGFAATLPAFQPAGYSINNLNSSTGKIAINYNNSVSSSSYTITEKPSGWDSASLRDLFVIPTDKNYQTNEIKGLTVYMYGSSDATWVNNETWYVVTGNGNLSHQQLINLASSM